MKRSEAIRRAAIRQLAERQQFEWLDDVLERERPAIRARTSRLASANSRRQRSPTALS